MRLYHGGRIEGAPEVRPHRGGHAEHGAGIYLTTSWETAAKYAKGGGRVYCFLLKDRLTWINEVRVPYDNALLLVKRLPRVRGGRADLMQRLRRWEAGVPAEVLLNLVVNTGSSSGETGAMVSRFLADGGVDAVLERRGLEDWVVVLNPAVVMNVSVVPPKAVGSHEFPFDLPRVSP